MRLDNFLGDGQTQAAALGLGRKKGLEDFFPDFGRDSRSGIANSQEYPVPLLAGANRQDTPGAHGLDAILGDIQDHLAQMAWIKPNLREIGVKRQHDLNITFA